MLSAKQLQSLTVTDLEQGRKNLGHISWRINQNLEKMRDTQDNAEHEALTNENFALRKARKSIQQKMGKIVARRMNK